jgi:uncharacterized protein YjbJ (UPF0337 family)
MLHRRKWEIDMNQDRLVGICMQFKGRLRGMSIDPLTAAAGRRDQLAGRIQEQRGIVKEATERELRNFLARNRNWRNLSSR